jgi:ABC-type phosphate/phosphonate transport system permease subunit
VNDTGQTGPSRAVSGKKGGLRSRWPNIVGWVISAAALAYVLSRVQLSELSKDLSGMTWWLVAAAILLEIVPRLLEAVRWRSLLQPVCTRFAELLQAIYIGTVYSSVLPCPDETWSEESSSPAEPLPTSLRYCRRRLWTGWSTR